VDRDDVRAFLLRGWAQAERLEKDHWARRHREEGPLAPFRAVSALLEHMRRARPDWPGASEREADLAHHVEQKRLLERASRALSPD
jgi:hypothetical protein